MSVSDRILYQIPLLQFLPFRVDLRLQLYLKFLNTPRNLRYSWDRHVRLEGLAYLFDCLTENTSAFGCRNLWGDSLLTTEQYLRIGYFSPVPPVGRERSLYNMSSIGLLIETRVQT